MILLHFLISENKYFNAEAMNILQSPYLSK